MMAHGIAAAPPDSGRGRSSALWKTRRYTFRGMIQQLSCRFIPIPG